MHICIHMWIYLVQSLIYYSVSDLSIAAGAPLSQTPLAADGAEGCCRICFDSSESKEGRQRSSGGWVCAVN